MPPLAGVLMEWSMRIYNRSALIAPLGFFTKFNLIVLA